MENGITTKVIACSAYDKNKTKSVVLFAGMADYVEKPVRKDELDRIIKNYVNLSV
jgi:DNA-binding response OmpR family regulator